MLEKQIKKLFAEISAINKRLADLDNGKFAEMRDQMKRVAAESRVVVNTVKSHGDVIDRLEKALEKLEIHAALDVAADESSES